MKRTIGLFALLLTAAVLVAGCGRAGGEKEEKKDSGAQGRYVENQIELPEKEFALAAGLIKNQEGSFEIYGYGKDELICYKSTDGAHWEPMEVPGWLLDISSTVDMVDQVRLGEDGCYYVLATEYGEEAGVEYSRQRVFKMQDEETAQEMKLPVLEEISSERDTYRMYKQFVNFQVTENGSLAAMDTYGEGVTVYSPEGREICTIDMVNPYSGVARDNCFSVQKNTVIGVKKGGKELLFFDAAAGKEEYSVEFPFTGRSKIAALSDGAVLIADKKGIHRLEAGGTLWQTVVDGQLNSMSMPTMEISELLPVEGEEERYLILCGEALYLYSFDEEIAAVPEKELTVYSLRENDTVRQAAALFQQKYKDVKVNYTVAMEEDSEDKKEDYIRAFNTELLDGNGADVIILDELPVDSYKEKGILKELSTIVDTSLLLPQAVETEEDGLYSLPIKVKAPFIMGTKDAVENSRDMDTLFSYVREQGNKDYIRMAAKYNFLDSFLSVYKEKLLAEDGSLKENEVRSFLENLVMFFENSGMNESEPEEFKSYMVNYSRRPGIFSNPVGLLKGRTKACVSTEAGFSSFYLVESLAQKVEDLQWELFGNVLFPAGRVGLNEKTQNEEMAQEFIRFLLSEEVQAIEVYDGFPVNLQALAKQSEKDDTMDTWYGSSSMDEDGTYVELRGTYPGRETRSQVVEKIKAAKGISGYIDTLHDLMFEEMVLLIDGERSIDETVEALTGKINTYLAE